MNRLYPRERWMPTKQTTASVSVYPDEKAPKPVLYGPKGEPLYRPPEPFGFAAGATGDAGAHDVSTTEAGHE